MPMCEVCDGDEFTELHGHFYCSNCQTQSQDFRVEEAEQEEFGQFAGHSNRIREKTVDKPKKKGKDQGRPWSIYEAYQIIIRHQVESLIKLGAQESLKDVVFKLWVNYLSRLGVAFTDKPKLDILKKYGIQREMFPGTTRKPIIKNVLGRKKRRKTVGVSSKTADKMQLVDEIKQVLGKEKFYEGDNPLEDGAEAGEGTDDEYSSEEDEEETKYGRGGKSVYMISIYKMQMRFTLAFCYIGLLYTNPGTTVSDLIRWVRKGQVPYLNVTSLLPEDFKFNMSDWTLFGRGNMPSAEKLRSFTGLLSNFLGLTDFPEFPLPELISKYILILDLPAEMHSLVINLYKSKSVITTYKPNKNYHKVPFWEGLAMAYIIITLKLYFGLNDHTEKLFSVYSRELMKLIDNSHQLFVWEDWVKHIKRKCLISDLFTNTSQQHDADLVSAEVGATVKENIRYKNAPSKLYQTGVREKITEPFIELGKRWKNKMQEGGNKSTQDFNLDLLSDLDSSPLFDEDPVGFLLGNFENNEENQEQINMQDKTDKSYKEELKRRSEFFRKTSLKHLSNPESYLDELDRHGLSDYTIQSSCNSSADSDEDWEPESSLHDSTNWDPDFSPSKATKSDQRRDKQPDSQTSLKDFIKTNVKSVSSASKVIDHERYKFVIEQVKGIHESFLLTFDPDQWSDCLAYNWLLQTCCLLIGCSVSDLGNEVKKVEVNLFAHLNDISKKGRYNFKRMKQKKLNYFTRRLKKF